MPKQKIEQTLQSPSRIYKEPNFTFCYYFKHVLLVCGHCKLNSAPLYRPLVSGRNFTYWSSPQSQLTYYTYINRPLGCEESFTLSEKWDHESQCQYRQVRCQYDHHGCDIVLSVKVIKNLNLIILLFTFMIFLGHVLA